MEEARKRAAKIETDQAEVAAQTAQEQARKAAAQFAQMVREGKKQK